MFALAAFLMTIVLILWRPGGIDEAVPALIGASILLLAGFLDRHDVMRVMMVVWNSAMTIISTFVMASVLERLGFFQWVGDRLVERAQGSGRRLFYLVLALSVCLTLFLNNDASILLGTPVVLDLARRFRMSQRAAFGYLLGACLMASAASPLVGVSNIANLEAMKLMGISLTEHFEAVLIPALIGLAACWILLGVVFGRDLPAHVALTANDELEPPDKPLHRSHPVLKRHPLPEAHRLPGRVHPLVPHQPYPYPSQKTEPDYGMMWFAVSVVVLVRAGFFAVSSSEIPPYLVAMTGAGILLTAIMLRESVDPRGLLKGAPWTILGFAFGIGLMVFGLRNTGTIGFVADWLEDGIRSDLLGASVLPGILVAGVSALLNNHPGLFIGSLTLMEMEDLTPLTREVAYTSIILGSDLGALLTPIGTLASLIWFHTLRKRGYKYSWREYLKVTVIVIPLSFLLSMCGLYLEACVFNS